MDPDALDLHAYAERTGVVRIWWDPPLKGLFQPILTDMPSLPPLQTLGRTDETGALRACALAVPYALRKRWMHSPNSRIALEAADELSRVSETDSVTSDVSSLASLAAETVDVETVLEEHAEIARLMLAEGVLVVLLVPGTGSSEAIYATDVATGFPDGPFSSLDGTDSGRETESVCRLSDSMTRDLLNSLGGNFFFLSLRLSFSPTRVLSLTVCPVDAPLFQVPLHSPKCATRSATTRGGCMRTRILFVSHATLRSAAPPRLALTLASHRPQDLVDHLDKDVAVEWGDVILAQHAETGATVVIQGVESMRSNERSIAGMGELLEHLEAESTTGRKYSQFPVRLRGDAPGFQGDILHLDYTHMVRCLSHRATPARPPDPPGNDSTPERGARGCSSCVPTLSWGAPTPWPSCAPSTACAQTE